MKWFQYYDENSGDGGDLSGGPVDLQTPAEPAAPAEPVAPAAPVENTTPADWPADWRTKLSPDGKHAKTLDRFASPNAVLDSYLALRQKVDSGELKSHSPFPDKGTPEEQNTWRKAHGIPEKPSDYSVTFGDGLVIGENDQPFVDEFTQIAHKTNASPEQVKEMLHWYYDLQDRNAQALEQRDTEFLQKSEDTLRAEWGGEYRTNVNIMRGLVDTLPESIRDLFYNARLGDGNALLNHPDMARWLVHTARTVNPVATVVPNVGANVAGAIDDEIAAIEKTMRTDRKAYNNDQKMQDRLRDLYGARERARK